MRRTNHFRVAALGCTLTLLWLAAGPAWAINLRSWDRKIDNANKRFKVLSQFNDEAVLDRETQLVWHRFPDTRGEFTWGQAISGCWVSDIGGRLGWRLATIVELSTLIDRTQLPALPAGHPFVLVLPAPDVWSSTTTPGAPAEAQTLDIDGGFLGGFEKDGPVGLWRWCVRGGGGIEGQ